MTTSAFALAAVSNASTGKDSIEQSYCYPASALLSARDWLEEDGNGHTKCIGELYNAAY